MMIIMSHSRLLAFFLISLFPFSILLSSLLLKWSSRFYASDFSSVSSSPSPSLNVFVADLPPELHYGLLQEYWAYEGSKSAHDFWAAPNPSKATSVSFRGQTLPVLPYPEDPLIKQYSAEYWLLGDLMSPQDQKGNSVARRVWNSSMADVIFVPFFATLSAELQLHKAKGKFRHTKDNADYDRQVQVVEFVKNTPEWQRSGGRDHVFVLTDPVAMWHVRSEIAPAVLLTVDFGGWYMEDAKDIENHGGVIQHRQVSILKDVIVPYTHLLPPLDLSTDGPRSTLAYFKGARHRHRTGLVRDKLWEILKDEPDIVFEEGFPNVTGQQQALKGMRGAEFCLHPAGDTPTSCRLFDAIMSLCIPVIISDNIELPFEGMLDYREFSLFVAVHDALQPKFLVNYLKGITLHQKETMRARLSTIQHMFGYDNGCNGGIGPVMEEGAVNLIWRKVLTKVPIIKEAILRDKRKPAGVTISSRCQCL